MNEKIRSRGHMGAIFTIVIWGTTFISTKVLLRDFTPIEILFFRFVMGYLALCLVCPRRFKTTGKKQELMFAGAGLTGICLYYLLENIALTYTLASNVGVIVSIAPFFTAILAHLFLPGERLKKYFFLGFLVSITGIILISFAGGAVEISPTGDILAISASVVWAAYSILTKKISGFGYSTLQVTKRIFFYGLLFMVPPLFFMDFALDLGRFSNTVYLMNIVYLGLGASALCFVTWNFALRVLGAVKTSIYIYLVPVVTIVFSVLILNEPVTWKTALGAGLTLAGLVISER